MHLDAFHDTIKACRFCFMCRHLSPIGNVTFHESDTPRGRALLLDRVQADPRLLAEPDFVQTLYDADLSAACRRHCVNHYDEAGLVLAARRDLVEAGAAPAAARALRDELAAAPLLTRGAASAEVVVFTLACDLERQPEIQDALECILDAAGISFRVVTSADSAKALHVLGFEDEARAHAGRVARVLTDGEAKTVVTSCPAAFDALRRDYAAWQVALPGLEVLHSAEFVLRLTEAGRLQPRRAAAGRRVRLLASDYLRNDANDHDAVGRLMERLGIGVAPFGTNDEESYSAGEGAVVLERLNPGLVGKLAGYVAARVEHPADDVLLTASPSTKHALLKYSGASLHVTTVEEIVRDLIA